MPAAALAVCVIGINLGVLISRFLTAEVLVDHSHGGGSGKVWRAWNA